jgi:GxxExxY protein
LLMAEKSLLGDDITSQLNGIAMKVHRILGRGLSEVLYKDALEYELQQAGIPYHREKLYKVPYCDIILKHKYKADFVVQENILLEVKARRIVIEDHLKQTLNYLAISKIPLAILYNFGEKSLFIKRIVL